MNILHEKRKMLPMGNPQEPITAFLVANATAIATSAVIGGVVAAVRGGNILKGALFGAIMGGIAAGVSSAFSGAATTAAEAAGGAAIEASTVPMTEAAWEAAGAANTSALNEAAIGSTVDSASQVAISPSVVAPAPVAAPVSVVGSELPSPVVGTNSVNGLDLSGSSKSLFGGSTNTMIGGPQQGGLLSRAFGSGGKLANTGLMIGGQMLLGAAQQRSQESEAARRQSNMSWVPAAQRGIYK